MRCSTDVARLAVEEGRVTGVEGSGGFVERFDHVVSTLPLPLLLGRLLDAPGAARRATVRLPEPGGRARLPAGAPRPEQWVYVFGRRHRSGG